jgi:hypothetical protein
MTPEERDIITRFIARISGAEAGGFAGSVPATAPTLPPIDPEADALIAELFTRYPTARYRLTQTAFVQEHALAEAQNRLRQMQAELEQARQQAQTAAPRAGGFFSGIFGGGGQGPAPGPSYQPPPPQYPPNYQPGLLQRSGSGFLGSALTTAAGVAGGMVVGNALMDLFSSHRAEAGGFSPTEPALPGGSPWSSPGVAPANPWDNVTSDPASGDAGWDSTQNDATPADPAGGWDDAANTPDDFPSFDDT